MNKILLALAIPFCLVGCALTTEKIDIKYQGRGNLTVVDGANSVVVEVLSEDKRTVFKDRVSAKKNGYGMEMAPIVSVNDVAKTFGEAVAFELENMGFRLGVGGKTVKVELIRFYNDFKTGFFSGDAVADGLITISVSDNSGASVFSRSYEGGAIEANIQLASGANAHKALTKAMSDIVGKIAQDKELHTALLK